MTIAEVSKKVNLSADTLRYYERIGLIPEVNRTESGIRNYTEEDLGWIEFSKCMRNAGMSIEALIEYIKIQKRRCDIRSEKTITNFSKRCNKRKT